MIAVRVGPGLRVAAVAPMSPSDGPFQNAGAAASGRASLRELPNAGFGPAVLWELERNGGATGIKVSGPLTVNEPELMLQIVLGAVHQPKKVAVHCMVSPLKSPLILKQHRTFR